MERLTAEFEDEPTCIFGKYLQVQDEFGAKCYIGDAADRLATYEDTGLEPEEIQKMKQDQAEREKGCEYCNSEKSFGIYCDGEKVGIAYLHKCSDGWGLFLQMDGGGSYYLDAANCPHCGKRLK